MTVDNASSLAIVFRVVRFRTACGVCCYDFDRCYFFDFFDFFDG
ncbi:hypothetical protein GCM10010507_34780 [Streptomyces cinnamoneus]|uniref:Uncharacterized protein n=1 Tax=Streptomyces cinnamoneus TaxID=53446 RepID=A0A918TMU6_STRCJ|nr:hypothetical protein GCM10010507_34780 [Streptomyces cinnamoneus]